MQNQDMPVVILCGGKGTRMREDTEYKPKPMAEIGGKPMLWHIMKTYSAHGFSNFVLALGYRGNVIRDYFANYDFENSDVTLKLGSRESHAYHSSHDERGWTVTLVETGQETMTGARLRRVKKYLGNKAFMATYGDAVTDEDLGKLLKFHQKHGKVATVTGIKPQSRFGELQAEGDIVTDFIEKPRLDAVWVNGGYFVLEQEVFDYIDGDDGCVFEKKPLERLAQKGELAMYRHDGFWHSMDTYRDYLSLNEIWDRGNVPWKAWK